MLCFVLIFDLDSGSFWQKNSFYINLKNQYALGLRRRVGSFCIYIFVWVSHWKWVLKSSVLLCIWTWVLDSIAPCPVWHQPFFLSGFFALQSPLWGAGLPRRESKVEIQGQLCKIAITRVTHRETKWIFASHLLALRDQGRIWLQV